MAKMDLKAKLLSAWGYQGDAMSLPVADVDESASYLVEKLGFEIVDRVDAPVRGVVLSRDEVRMAVNENGGDPTQDGVAFRVDNVESLRDEFIGRGLDKIGAIKDENRDDGEFRSYSLSPQMASVSGLEKRNRAIWTCNHMSVE